MTTAEERRAQKEAYLASLKSQKSAPPKQQAAVGQNKIGLDFDSVPAATKSKPVVASSSARDKKWEIQRQKFLAK